MGSSFYGGRAGASISLAKIYPSFRAMTMDIGSTEDVEIGELVLISTERLKPDGHSYDPIQFQSEDMYYGNLYKKTTVSPYYQLYGNIKGSVGTRPIFNFNSMDEVADQNAADITAGYYPSKLQTGDLDVEAGLIAGKKSNGKINFNYYTISKIVQDNIDSSKQSYVTNEYLGMDIPYLELNPSINKLQYNDTPKVQVLDMNEAEGDNPFYRRILFEVPQGVHGTSLEDITSMTIIGCNATTGILNCQDESGNTYTVEFSDSDNDKDKELLFNQDIINTKYQVKEEYIDHSILVYRIREYNENDLDDANTHGPIGTVSGYKFLSIYPPKRKTNYIGESNNSNAAKAALEIGGVWFVTTDCPDTEVVK